MTTPTDDLQQRCAEVLEWQKTGELRDGALRQYAAKHWHDHHDSLQMAERDTAEQAMTAIAKWGQPQAVANGETVYAFRRKGLDDFCTCDEARYEELSTKPNLFEVRVFYTAPPPQAVREPRVSEDQWRVLCEQTWGLLQAQDRSAALQLLLDGFKARGITKGGQHGAE